MTQPDIFIYDGTYPYFKDSLANTENFRHEVRTAVRDYLRVWLPLRLVPGTKLLDVGSNIGGLGHFLKFSGVHTTGVDLNLDAIRAGRNIYGSERTNRSFIADGKYLPFKSNSFDAIVSQDMLEHVPNQEDLTQIFTEMDRVLKPNRDKMFHKITVLEDEENIHADESHSIKWTTQEWYTFFTSRGWKVLGNPTKHFPIMSSISYGNFLVRRAV
jgi:cyclopropane fatty-acyl-phospholipid synthase-like methyltransferase